MIVLHETARDLPVEPGEVRQAVEAVPLEAGERPVGREGQRLVVVLDVAGVDEEVRVEFEHPRVDPVAVWGVPSGVILATGHHEGDGSNLVGSGGGAECPLDRLARRSRCIAALDSEVVAGAGRQFLDPLPEGVVFPGVDRLPAGGAFLAVFGRPGDADATRRAGHRPLHVVEGFPFGQLLGHGGGTALFPGSFHVSRRFDEGGAVAVRLRVSREARPDDG